MVEAKTRHGVGTIPSSATWLRLQLKDVWADEQPAKSYFLASVDLHSAQVATSYDHASGNDGGSCGHAIVMKEMRGTPEYHFVSQNVEQA